jgi:CubicO group peptidase (beta-lactamase class C family)
MKKNKWERMMFDISRRHATTGLLSFLTLGATGCASTSSGLGNLDTAAPVDAASVGFDATKLQALDTAMAKAVADGAVVGMSTLLVRHGKVVQAKTYGMASVSKARPMAKDTIFRIFSMTKPITGVALMMLFEEGKWSLDDPISKFLPEYANLRVFTGKDAAGEMITVPAKRPPNMRELMSHTAGFGYGLAPANPVDDMFRAKQISLATNLEDLATKVATIPLMYQPGESWSYSISVDLQARIVEVISGQKFGNFLQSRIFAPLGMRDTAFYVAPEKLARFGDVYAQNPTNGTLFELNEAQTPRYPSYSDPTRQESGGGGLVSTINDYGRFCQMILNKGQAGRVRLLKPESIALMGVDAIPARVIADNTLIGAMGTSPFRFGNGVGFGLDFMVVKDPKLANLPVGTGTLSWGGAAGTWFWIDPENDLYFVGMIQRFPGTDPRRDLRVLSQQLIYGALNQPTR